MQAKPSAAFEEWSRGPVPIGAVVLPGVHRCARFAYHGVPKVFANTAPDGCGLPRGRLNITMRVAGLGDGR